MTVNRATSAPAHGYDSAVLAGRHLRLMSRRPSSIISALILPVVFAVLFLTVFGRVMERAGLDYPQYMLPAIVIQTLFFSAMSGSIWAAEDASSGMVSRLRAMPISRAAPVISLLIGESARSLLSSLVIIGVGYGFGFRFQTGPAEILGFFALVALASVAICLPYLVLGYALAAPEATQAIGGAIYFPLLLVSTLFVPVDAYPDWLQGFVEHQPLSVTADALRALSTSGVEDPGSAVFTAVIWLAGLIIVFGALAPRIFARVK